MASDAPTVEQRVPATPGSSEAPTAKVSLFEPAVPASEAPTVAAPAPPGGRRVPPFVQQTVEPPAVVEEPETAPPPAPEPPAPRPVAVRRDRSRSLLLAAAVSALVAIVCALSLPFAPVVVNEPTVSWPRDPARPESTLLQLTAYHPLSMNIAFSCAVARAAQAQDGVVLSTTSPENPIAGSIGLIVTARGDRVEIRGLGRVLLSEPLPSGPCTYRIAGTSNGLPSFVRPEDPAHPILPPMSDFAQPGNAHLTVMRDDVQVADAVTEQLPDVDSLVTSVRALPDGAAGQLAVQLRTDDEFTTSPTPFKSALIWLLVAAAVATVVLLGLLDRTVPRVPTRWRFALPRVVDAVVPAVIVYWMFLAPATDDDGYYAQMAHNSVITGRVGNYYQLYDQNFTPFTWFYQALGWWQQIAGMSPVAERVPAMVFGILTWILLRRFVGVAMREFAPDRRLVHVLAHAVLAVVYLAWWTALDMGVRPETIVGTCAAGALLAVLAAHRRKRLVFAWLAVAVAGAGFVAHPTGFTLFAPLLAGLPLLWPVLRVPGSASRTALRVLAVASAGMFAPLLAFADGSLRDFLRGQKLFLAIQAQDDWTGEYQRYAFLLAQGPMGNYAKRAAVLAAIVVMVWFVALAAAARMRKVALPTPLWLSGTSLALAFGLLWLTPSKWSHHFGALAGVGSAFLALFLVTAVPLTRQVLARDPDDADARVPVGVVAAAAVTLVATVSLAWHGPNIWPYAWMEGMLRPGLPPVIGTVPLDSPPVWVVVLAVATVVVALVTRRLGYGRDLRLTVLRAVAVVLVCSLATSVGYSLTTFGSAAATGTPKGAVWSDPTGADCTAAGAVRVYDPTTAEPLVQAFDLPAPALPAAFAAGSGYYTGNRPQGAGAGQVWGSLVAQDGGDPERNTGSMSTPWFSMPDVPTSDATALTLLAAGTLSDGNTLTATYGVRTGGGVVAVGSQQIEDPTHDPSWRTFTLRPSPGADLVRIDAVDTTGADHGWLAFSSPSLERAVPLQTYFRPSAPVALAWQLAFAYPCQRQPDVHDGITESPRYGVAYGLPDASLSGFGDGIWQQFRGGVYAATIRSQAVQQLAVAPGTDPHIEVISFGSSLARDAYTVTTTERVSGGADTSVGNASG